MMVRPVNTLKCVHVSNVYNYTIATLSFIVIELTL